MFQLDACIVDREAPVDDGWILIPFREPSVHFVYPASLTCWSTRVYV